MDAASPNRSLAIVRAEIEYLRASSVINKQQCEDILARLPQRAGNVIDGDTGPDQHTGRHKTPSSEPRNSEPRHATNDAQKSGDLPHPGNDNLASAIALAAQNPNHPAHPKHPKVRDGEDSHKRKRQSG